MREGRCSLLALVLSLQCFPGPLETQIAWRETCCRQASEGCWDQKGYTSRLCCFPDVPDANTTDVDAISCHPARVSVRCDRAASQAMAKWRYDRPFDRGVFLTVQSDWVQCFVDEELCLVFF